VRLLLYEVIHSFRPLSLQLGAAVFDKDDDLAVDFVTAAANLRSIAYHIPTQSFFDAKVGAVT
jgi:ubiquitin-like 1-activating enzyme E1 B